MITLLDPIYCKADKEDIFKIAKLLKYTFSYWKNAQFGKKEISTEAYFIDRRNGIFLCGFLPRIKQKFPDLKISGTELKIIPENPPALPGITFRKDQYDLIQKAAKYQRGVLVSPTGSGKTILALGFMSMFPSKKILFICPSISILKQVIEEAKKFGFKDIGFIGAGEKDLSHRISIASIQTLSKIKPEVYCDKFDITIIDECHHLSSKNGIYYKFMTTNLSPIRIGFTATLPTKQESKLCLEGCLGPVIGELTLFEGNKIGILAKPKITLISIGKTTAISEFKKYKDIYYNGIVKNKSRNRLIVNEALKRIKHEKSILIMVKEIQHAYNILEIASLFNVKMEFVYGSTNNETRENIKELLNSKKVKCVIATAVWREGINIPSLDCIINACGGKSEIMTLQSIGRGLRTTASKTEVEIIDFLDPYRYLAEHCIIRLQIYRKFKWI